ncbi:hatching enzyme 1.2-like [Chironomus tepperi]|uniref:hatching enzyme 1.2-like n=1 Tax=Chironomus tepperi TaxID=113505 RepID=UPI00391F4096
MSERIYLCLNLLILITKLAAYPVNNDDKIVFFEEEDERFNDIIDPIKLLKQKVNKLNYKNFVNKTVVTISRFDDTDIDDNADDLKGKIHNLVLSDQLVESANKTEEFLVDDFVKQGLENGEYFQGDMIIAKNQEKFFFGNETEVDENGLPSRTGIIDTNYRWRMRNGLVVIPYKFWSSSRFTSKQKTMIRLAMDDIEMNTCIRFTPRSRESDFILIYSGDDCSSFLGRAGGEQLVSLRKDGCFSRGIIIHELIHTLGYDHMQNHPDRDQYVKILWNNIKQDSRYNFDKLDSNKFSNFGTQYDYYSIMHYDPLAFSRNGRRTIVPIEEQYRNVIGQRTAMSKGDVARINIMYECDYGGFYK